MLVLEAFPLEALLLELLEPHVGHGAEGRRVADDAKFAIDEIAICRILDLLFFLEGEVFASRRNNTPLQESSKNRDDHNHGNWLFSHCSDSDGSTGCAGNYCPGGKSYQKHKEPALYVFQTDIASHLEIPYTTCSGCASKTRFTKRSVGMTSENNGITQIKYRKNSWSFLSPCGAFGLIWAK